MILSVIRAGSLLPASRWFRPAGFFFIRISALLAVIAASFSAPAAANEYRAEVLRVIDGDTFEARIEVWPGIAVGTSVRLAGIDAPELRARCPAERDGALRAFQALSEALARLPVTVTDVRLDKFAGRVDAHVTAGGQDVAQQLLNAGLAVAYSGTGPRKNWCGD